MIPTCGVAVRRMLPVAVIAVAAIAASGLSRAADDALLAAAQTNVDKFIAGTETSPPSSGPKAVAGKSIYVVSCGQAVPGCSLQTNAAVEAGKTLGWSVTLVDGAFNANDGYNKGIRQAIAAQANGIILVSIDCNRVSQALREASTAGVKVVGQNSFTCADEPSLMTPIEYSSTMPNLAAFGQTEGTAQADYIIVKTKGMAKVLNFRLVDNTFAIQINTGFEQEISKCGTCTVKNGDISLSDYSNPTTFQRKASSALLGAADADVIHVPFDSFITNGVGQAVVNAGRAESMQVVGSEGFAANINLMREKRGQTAVFASDQQWIGWASADTMNRIFASVKPAPAGIGFKLLDADHGPLPSGDYHSAVDFKSAYKAVWGL